MCEGPVGNVGKWDFEVGRDLVRKLSVLWPRAWVRNPQGTYDGVSYINVLIICVEGLRMES